MDVHNEALSPQAAQAMLERIWPGSVLQLIQPVSGEYANRNFYVDARSPEGRPLKCVVKLFQGERDFIARLARTEYAALGWLHQQGSPVPAPLFLDEEGALLGGPALVTAFLPGAPVMSPPYPPDWGKQMAQTLASLHAFPCHPAEQPFLRDANANTLWFLRSGAVPGWMARDSDGERVWRAVAGLRPTLVPVTPCRIHTDFWAGNLLVEDGIITAVLDWGEAGYGDPGSDVAYCLMDLVLCGLDEHAGAFLDAYAALTGGPTPNLGFWMLAAAARPMLIPEGWIDTSPARERYRAFIEDAFRRLGAP